MTNETAIVYLKNLIRDDYRQQKIAINKAIKALEQQPCEDCISREEALNEINKKVLCYTYEARKIIENLPSVTPSDEALKEAYIKGYDYGVKDWFETKTKTATWIYDKSIDGYYCSKCKTSHYKVMTPYCANCGAKMKKEKVND